MSVSLAIDVGEMAGAAGLNPLFMHIAEGILAGYVQEWERSLLDIWPVDTGTSLAAWRVWTEGLVWHVANPIEYVPFVHLKGQVGFPLWPRLERQAWQAARLAAMDIDTLVQRQAAAVAMTAATVAVSARSLLARQSTGRDRFRDRQRARIR